MTNNTKTTTTVIFYANDASTVLRTHTYPTRAAAVRAMKRASKLHQVSAIARKRTTDDQPTCHH